jgi:hypothetical protein
MRVSNDDREKVAQVLHNAMAEGRLTVTELEERLDKVYEAKTFGDLEPLVRDLPVGQQSRSLAVPTHATSPVPSNRIGGRGTSTGAVAVMSGSVRKGAWTVPPTFTSFALMGGIELDLTDARFEDAETTIQCFAFMGGIDVYVPEDVIVQVNGSGFMGAFEDKIGHQQHRPGAPVVKITGLAVWGGVDVKRSKKTPRNDQHQIGE